jgi:Nif-specific regulatory protein
MKLKVMVNKHEDPDPGNLIMLGDHVSGIILRVLQTHGIEIDVDVLSVTLIPDDGQDAPLKRRQIIGRTRLLAAMERAGWIQTVAARLLGLTPRQVGHALKHHKITKRGLSPRRSPKDGTESAEHFRTLR